MSMNPNINTTSKTFLDRIPNLTISDSYFKEEDSYFQEEEEIIPKLYNDNSYIDFYKNNKNDSFIHQYKINRYEKSEGELHYYLTLEDDWDNYGAITPNKSTIQACINFLLLLKKLDIVGPKTMLNSEGEVSLYWKTPLPYIEICFHKESIFSYIFHSSINTFGEDNCNTKNGLPEKLYSELQLIEHKN